MINQTIVVLDFPASQAWHWWRPPIIRAPRSRPSPSRWWIPCSAIFLGGPAWETFMSQKVENMLRPWKLTCPLKIDGWKMYSLLGHVSFQGCKLSKISVKLQLISTIFVQFCGDAIFKRMFPWSNTICCNNVIWLSKHLLEKTTRSSFASPPLGSETCKCSHQTTRKLHLLGIRNLMVGGCVSWILIWHQSYLVGGFNSFEKYYIVKLDHISR